MTMDCPVCIEPMLVVEYAQVELDTCAKCRGIWFDAGEIDLLFEKAGIPESERGFGKLLETAGPTREAPRSCPLCRKKMAKARVGPAGPVIDRCVREDGLWFDSGEVGQMLAVAGASDCAARVLTYLQEVFPKDPKTRNERR